MARPEHRQGGARCLLVRAVRGAVTLASNPKASGTHALYERWGWQKMGIEPGKPGSYYSEYVRFVLLLPLPAAER